MTLSAEIRPVGEIVEATSTAFVAECIDLTSLRRRTVLQPPALGSFVFVRTKSVVHDSLPESEGDEVDPFVTPIRPGGAPANLALGVVSYAVSGVNDQGRRAAAYGIESEEELRSQQPQIFELIKSEFSVILTSMTTDSGVIQHRLPLVPPRLHAFVYPADRTIALALTDHLGFLRTLTANSEAKSVHADDLIAAVLRTGWELHAYDDEYLVRAGKSVLSQVQWDFDRLQAIIERIR